MPLYSFRPFLFIPISGIVIAFTVCLGIIPGKAQKVYHCTTGIRVYEMKAGSTVTDTAVFKLLSAYRDSLALKMEEIVIENKAPLSKTQPESTLGNWISDAARSNVSRQVRKADVCLFSYGCIGKDYLPPGPVRRKDFYELIPFEYKMVLLSVSGSILSHLCDSIAHINGMPVSGLSFMIGEGKAINIRVDGHPLNDNRVYTLLLNDYLLSRYRQLLGKLPYRHSGLYLRKLLVDESIAQQGKGIPVHAILEKRIAYAE